MKGAQLPLAVQLRDTASFESFFAGANDEAVAALRTMSAPVLLYGAPRSGRTHLLQAACRVHGGAYLPLTELATLGPSLLDGYAETPALFIDDVDAVSDDEAWCTALIRVIDHLRSHGHPYALSAAAAPDRLHIARTDLRTRLTQCTVIGLRPLDDDQRRALLQLRAQLRGLRLPDDVARWLLTTRARDTGSLIEAIEILDRETLTRKRRLTLALAQAVLSDASARTSPD
jgi:DnaA family protein